MLYVDTKHEYRGRKAQIGSIMFGSDVQPRVRGSQILVFAGYCPGCKHKVAMDREDAEHFARRFVNPGLNVKQRLARSAIKMLERTTKERRY